jgi:SAM-dependent methyltransferase
LASNHLIYLPLYLFCRVLAAKFAAYSQLEVVRTGMLSRHVKAKDARVLQLGGTTRDLFYYPKGTLQVTAAAEDLKEGLWEQAGMQCGVPVRPLKASSATALSNSAGAAFDSVVAFDQLGSINDFSKYFSDVWRVLKPGGTFIFIQRISGSPVAGLVRLGGTAAAAGNIL